MDASDDPTGLGGLRRRLARLPAMVMSSARVTVSLDELAQLKAEAHGFSFLPRQPVSSFLSGRHSSRLRGRGLDFEELRRYRPGDDIRAMDWRATARRRSPHVRVYREERERPVLLAIDQRSPMFFGSRRAMKSVAAAEAAALAAWRALDAGDRIGGIVFSDADTTELQPRRSRGRVMEIFRAIVVANQRLASDPPTRRAGSLNDALSAARRLANHDHLVVLISDFDGADDDTRRLATEIAAHNDLLAVLVYDPLGASLQGHAGMRATDETQTWEIPPGERFAHAFREVFAQELRRWRDVFRALKVPVLPISASEPVAGQIRRLFGGAPILR